MKVNHFNTYLHGGAAKAAIKIFTSLLDQQVDAAFYYRKDIKNDLGALLPYKDCFFSYEPLLKNNSLLRSLRARYYYWKSSKILAGRPEGLEQFSLPVQFFKNDWSNFRISDIIHLHWINEWIDYPSFFEKIPASKPIVWTLHDMNGFTAGCHYSWECNQYVGGCNSCFQLGKQSNKKNVERFFTIKQAALKNKNLHIVADSEWLAREAGKSKILQDAKSIQTIHYGVDTHVFRKKELVQESHDWFNVAFGAASFDNMRKGFSILIKALEQLACKGLKIRCLVFGSGNFENFNSALDVKFFGSIEVADKLADVYNEADVFVIPSLEEAFGQTSLEAMACGTPVVGFDVGGIVDTVKNGHTGLLAQRGDCQDLADKLEYLYQHRQYGIQLGANARKFVCENFSVEAKAHQYINLYQKITN